MISTAKRRAASALAVLALAAAAARADDRAPVPDVPASARALTWDDCVRAAFEKSPDLLSATRASEQGRASWLQSYNGVLPSASLSNSYASGSATNGRAGYSAAASASMSVFDMGKIASIRSASASYDQTLASLRSASASVRFALRQAYANVLFAEESVDVARTVLAIRKTGADMVTLRYQSGHEYKGNMMNAQAQQLQAEIGLAQAIRSLRSTRRAFARQLGFDDFAEVTATGTLSAAAPPPPPTDESSLVEHRPDVQLQEAVLKSAKASVASSETSLWPSLTANYARTRGSAPREFPGSPYGWTAGATLSLPLFAGGPTAAYFSIAASKRGLEKAEQDLRVSRDAAVVDLENAWASYANAVDQALVQRATLASSRQRNDEADVRYASGLLTFDNWTVIVSQRVSDEQSAVQTVRDAVVAQAAWEKSLGRVLGE